ncbi:MAG: hypothetical protein INH41_25780 [Myxococcaceae bacterium]|nr:hypothetical protein [Myxococcaceae bacterium]MCA3015812.1 hypothetical protein [Myxococcaceae bacterium]
MRWTLVMFVAMPSCAPMTALSRARGLEASAGRCERFSTFEPTLAQARQALPLEAQGDELVPASQALSAARRSCARATVEKLLELQQREGRAASATEVDALARAFGADEALELLRAQWGADADRFAPDLALATYAPGPTPPQAPPVEPVDPRGAARPELPEPTETGRGADCLRREMAAAAACLGEWNRDGADAAELDAAVARLRARVEAELAPLDDERRAGLLGQVFSGLALSSDRAVVAPLVKRLEAVSGRLLPQAEQLSMRGFVERGASLARPFLSVDVTRRRAEPLCRAAARKHTALANDAGPRPLARAVHLATAAGFLGASESLPPLPPGRWDTVRWDCPTSSPSVPALPPGALGRVVGFCRKTAAPPHATQSPDAALRTFEYEATLERVAVRADVTVTCGGAATTKRLEATDVLLDAPTPGNRPGPLDGPLAQVAREVAVSCRAAAETEAASECRRLEGDPLDVAQAFARLAQRLGAWPPCFTRWFRDRYDVAPPALATGR